MKLEEIAIFTDQVKATTAFYLTLGGKIVYQNEGMAIVAFDNVKMLIHARYEPGENDLPCENHIAFGTPNVDEEIKRLTSQGVTIDYEPENYDWGRSAYLRDPNGMLVELAQLEEQK
ncbi:MAG: VOC family protein [Anaerolineaceae bacterium]|nr:VOC family protein [Anaerolineaceae bacterium]